MELVDTFVQGMIFLPTLLCKGLTKTRKKRARKQTPTHKYMHTKHKKLKKY